MNVHTQAHMMLKHEDEKSGNANWTYNIEQILELMCKNHEEMPATVQTTSTFKSLYY